jgi:aspartyl-tRNA(Asn)/glutamyl-tRNA(Gln) amidotransferase subunit A
MALLHCALELITKRTNSVKLVSDGLAGARRVNSAYGAVILEDAAFDQLALDRAAAIDIERETNGFAPSIVAGIPISIKDNFNVAGSRTTAGSGEA